MTEDNSFWSNLFDNEIIWSLHTAMTCNLAYTSAVAVKATGKSVEKVSDSDLENIAFFYQPNYAKGRCLTFKAFGTTVNARKFKKSIYEINNLKKTFHAKISLVNYSKDGNKGYRLAVYSKNFDFNDSCCESALLFELKQTYEETKEGKELCEFLDFLQEYTTSEGKNWLEKNISHEVIEELNKVEIVPVFDFMKSFETDLFFGGLKDTNTTLGTRMELEKVIFDESIFITPPIFVKDTKAEKFFKKKKCLYDLNRDKSKAEIKRSSSHIKLYLLKKNKGTSIYELWLGSANATRNGLGIDFDELSNNKVVSNVDDFSPSIECMVRFGLTEVQYKKLKEEIEKCYKKYDFKDEPTLQINRDIFGPWIVSNYKVAEYHYCDEKGEQLPQSKKEKSYRGKAKKIIIRITKIDPNKKIDVPENLNDSRQCFRPAEYKELSDKINIYDDKGNIKTDIDLEYNIEHFTPSQGLLLFGSSNAAMFMDTVCDLPLIDNKHNKDLRLSTWLLGQNEAPEFYDDDENEELSKMYSWIFGGNADD